MASLGLNELIGGVEIAVSVTRIRLSVQHFVYVKYFLLGWLITFIFERCIVNSRTLFDVFVQFPGYGE